MDAWILRLEKAETIASINKGVVNGVQKSKEEFYDCLKLLNSRLDDESDVGDEVLDPINEWNLKIVQNLVDYDSRTYVLLDKVGMLDVKPENVRDSPKVNNSPVDFSVIKPDKLSRSFMLEEFDCWMESFKGYYKISGMSSWENKTQVMYAMVFLDSDVKLDIERFITKETTVFGTEGILELLEDSFCRRHPLVNQKIAYRKACQGSEGPETDVDYMKRMFKWYRRSRFGEQISRDEDLKLQIISGISSEKMRKELMKEFLNLSVEGMLEFVSNKSDGKVVSNIQGQKSKPLDKKSGFKKPLGNPRPNTTGSSMRQNGSTTTEENEFPICLTMTMLP